MPTWQSRIAGHGAAAPADLTANPAQWREHPDAQATALAEVLAEVGWVQEVIVNRRTGHLVDGHLRVALALERGEATVPVSYVELSDAEEQLVLASLDPLTGMATTDPERLAALLSQVTVSSDTLRARLESLSDRVEPRPGLTDPDATLAERATDIQPGDLFELGGHRLLCGDATNPDAVARVLQDEVPPLMATDPPYGVDYDAEWRQQLDGGARLAVGRVANDDRADWTAVYRLFPGSVAYVWHAGLYASIVEAGLAAAGFQLRAQIVWVKPHFVISRGHYHAQHEPCWVATRDVDQADVDALWYVSGHELCWYGVRGGASVGWTGDRKQSTVWEVRNLSAFGGRQEGEAATGHGTQKPVEVFIRPLRNHTRRGDACFEPFSGSGTALIAAEQLARRCLAIELEPGYVQLAIDRWEAFTGQRARKVGDAAGT